MKIKDLVNAPQWLKAATVIDEDVLIEYGQVLWRGGEWYGGVWCGGVWCGGVWRGGEWYGGEWRGGVWRGGVWHGGVWCGGVWCGGVWRGGEWYGGEWHGQENRLLYMAAQIGIVFDASGQAVAYRTTKKDGRGRWNEDWTQPEGEYYETRVAPAGAGTCCVGIHVTSAAEAWRYFGIDPTCQFWRVTFKKEDLLDCDGAKARIRGGVFEKIERPF